jgi:hypothetical protein
MRANGRGGSAPVFTGHPLLAKQAAQMPRTPALPWWFWLAYADFRFWFVTAPAAIALLLTGWYDADWLGGLRFAVLGAGTLMALPFPAVAAAYVLQSIDATRYRRTLDSDETIAGVTLPIDSRICFADKAHANVVSVDLPHVTGIHGVRVVGRLMRYEKWNDVGPVWSGTLAEDQVVNGFPCRSGYFAHDKFGTVFDDRGHVHKFGLAAAHEFFGLTFPAGTAIRRGNGDRPWTFLLPEDAGVHVPALATSAPPGTTLTIANDGQLENIDSGHGQTIIVHGLPLSSKNFRSVDGRVVSELAEPAFVKGEMRAVGTSIAIDLSTGNLVLPQ